jgi:hypothetical protein
VYHKLFILILFVVFLGSYGRAHSQMVTPPHCDVALVLALDTSGSVDTREFSLQVRGTSDAFRSPEVLAAIANGFHGRIAVSLIQFATFADVSIGWRIIDGPASARAFADEIDHMKRQTRSGTRVSSALRLARSVLSSVPCTPERKVVDVSGDGIDDDCYVDQERSDLLHDEVVINAVSVGSDDLLCPADATRNAIKFKDLQTYFDSVVRGGPGSFAVHAPDFDSYADTIRAKIVLEIS